jgi:DNA-binding winged helix-turn-helix (wHTH) protein
MSLPASHAGRNGDLGLTPHAHGVYEVLGSRPGKVVIRRQLVRGAGRSRLSDQQVTVLVAAIQRAAGRARVRAIPGRGWRFYT